MDECRIRVCFESPLQPDWRLAEKLLTHIADTLRSRHSDCDILRGPTWLLGLCSGGSALVKSRLDLRPARGDLLHGAALLPLRTCVEGCNAKEVFVTASLIARQITDAGLPVDLIEER